MKVESQEKKEKFIRPNLRQTTAAKLTVENMANGNPLTMSEILQKAGYSKWTSIAKTRTITDNEGYKLSLEIYLRQLGIDKKSRLTKLAEILYDSDKRASLGANDQITKMLGEYAPVKQEIDDIREKRKELIIKPE